MANHKCPLKPLKVASDGPYGESVIDFYECDINCMWQTGTESDMECAIAHIARYTSQK